MKLLFDQNLSYRLVPELESLYPGSVHTREVALATADDETVWHFAQGSMGSQSSQKIWTFTTGACSLGSRRRWSGSGLGHCTTARTRGPFADTPG